MLSIVLLGTGNLAVHLFEAFASTTAANVVQVYGRNKQSLSYFDGKAVTTNNPDHLLNADIYICAVSDDVIELVSKYPKQEEAIILHCSGAAEITVLPEGSRRGVFYPLQTFSKGRKVDFSQIPICIESDSPEVEEMLLSLGRSISNSCIVIDSTQRKALHLAAVFANNFTNHLLHRAHAICSENKLPFSLLQPLIEETVNKLHNMSPLVAQTGPARRGDLNTQQEHMKLMSDIGDREIYRILSQAIQDTYGNQF